ncbi:MAG TPA: FAD:protein FMN transferase, partial [Gammaproteobacteria bacterium]|nr:FAD:protein FMN transferase [Gammaproteobacteria bacterium]
MRCLATTLALLLALAGCGREAPSTPYQSQFLALGTLVNISLWGVDDDQGAAAVRAVEDELNRVYDTWHAWRPSTLTDLNRRLA